MSKFFLYNGVRLPALPEWDKTVYPYAFIYAVGTNVDGVVSEVCTLVISASNQMVYDSIGIGFRYDAIGIGKTISTDDTQWVDWTWNSGGSEYFYVKRDEPTDVLYIRVVWANFDVLNSDGSVYVAASEPVPVAEKFPLREWLSWRIAGLCSRPLPVSVREPVAYLYGSERAPALPDWNEVKYPYACYAGVVSKALYFSQNPVYYYGGYWVPAPFLKCKLSADGTTWQPAEEVNEEYKLPLGAHWANHDIYYTNDVSGEKTLYLAASDPIPVYE